MNDFNDICADDQQRHANKLDTQFGWSFKAHPAAPGTQGMYLFGRYYRHAHILPTVQTHG